MCEVELASGPLHLPEIERPAVKSPDEYLADLCWANFKKYYPEPTEERRQRFLGVEKSADEDPRIRELYVKELAREGIECAMPPVERRA